MTTSRFWPPCKAQDCWSGDLYLNKRHSLLFWILSSCNELIHLISGRSLTGQWTNGVLVLLFVEDKLLIRKSQVSFYGFGQIEGNGVGVRRTAERPKWRPKNTGSECSTVNPSIFPLIGQTCTTLIEAARPRCAERRSAPRFTVKSRITAF